MKTELTMHCGAKMHANNLKEDLTGKRLVVFDTESNPQQPKFPDGKLAPCFGNCPCARKSGRKYDRCFPSDESKSPPPWRHVVTCKVASVAPLEEKQ